MKPLHYKKLYQKCDIKKFDFTTTETLTLPEQILGQERALEAVDMSANIKQDGFNLFAMGPMGSGKHSMITHYLENKAAQEPAPDDWCYVNNFQDPLKPLAIRLPNAQAQAFKKNLDASIEILKAMLPKVFESNEYRNAKNTIAQKYIDYQDNLFVDLQKKAAENDIAIKTSSAKRVTFAPIFKGKILDEHEYQALPDKEKKLITANMNKFEALVSQALYQVTEYAKKMQIEFKVLDKQMTSDIVVNVMNDLRQIYSDHEKIQDYFNAMQEDIIENVKDFLIKPDETGLPPMLSAYYLPSLSRYRVNVFISHEASAKQKQSSHIIYENNPSYQNLIGRVEHSSQLGTLTTDFNMIRPGALHQANGGYLILDARKILMEPFAWEGLKRILLTKSIKIESMAQKYSLISTVTLEPEPIPLKTKVVLIGERTLYYLLHHYDPEFQGLFKVVADFEEEITRTDTNIKLYAQLIGSMAKSNHLLPLNRHAVGRVIEYASRYAQHASKLSTHLSTLSDLLKEADYYAQKAQRNVIDIKDIEGTLQAQEERQNRLQKHLYEQIQEGTLLIHTQGEAVGQINGLSVLSLDSYRFAVPMRITALTRMGKGDLIDIDRHVELSGPIHSKGVMILASYLSSKYAYDTPLSLAVSLAFEQSYGKIDGDSASSAELYAILSSLSGLPIKQNFAVTGSINQMGEVQAIGGVNEKIEGFFDIAMRLNPDQEHAVLIPASNVKHLMLQARVVEAVKEKRFAIYAVNHVEEGIAILTGVQAGKKSLLGNYPKHSVNYKITQQLHAFTAAYSKAQKSLKADRSKKSEEKSS